MSKKNNKVKPNDVKVDEPMKSFWKDKGALLSAGIAIIFGLICFLQTVNFDYVNWDDDKNVYDNELVTTITADNFVENTKGIFTTDVIGNYNPLPIWTFALENLAFGMDSPGKMHMNNVFLHLICVLLIFRISRLLGLKNGAALLVALLFAIHPMRVESVAWITERKDVLFGVFFLGALFYYVKRKVYGEKKYTLIITVLFILALFSKIQAVVLPLSMIAIDYYLSGKITKKDILSKIPLFALSLAFGIFGIMMLKGQGSLEQAVYNTWWERLTIGSFTYFIYVIKAIVPFELSPIYPYPSKLTAGHFAGLLMIPTTLYFLYYTYKKELKVWFFGILFFTFNIMFLLQIIGAGQGYLADRFTYIAYFGLFFIAGYYVQKFSSKTAVYIIASIAVIVFSVITTRQTEIWENGETLWTHAIAQNDRSVLSFRNRAIYRRDLKQVQGALEDCTSAINLDSTDSEIYNTRAKLYFDLGGEENLKKAVADYDKAIQYDTTTSDFYSNRGAAHIQLGHTELGMYDLNKGLEINPKNAVNYRNRYLMYREMGDYDKAIKDVKSYLKLRPEDADMWFEHARCMRLKKQDKESIPFFTKAIELVPNNGFFYYERSKTYYTMGDMANAKKDYLAANERRAEIDPEYHKLMQAN